MIICQVYEAEKVVTRTRVYHRSCLACSVCSRGLEAATATEAGDGRVYCRGCYSRHCCTTLYCTLHQHYADPRQFCSLVSHRYGARAGVRAGAQEAGCARCGDKVFSVDQVHHLQHVTCVAPGARWWRARASCTTASASPAPPAPPSSPPPASAAARTGTSTAGSATAQGDGVLCRAGNEHSRSLKLVLQLHLLYLGLMPF